MDILLIIGGVILGDAIVMAAFVLLLNPRLGAAATKTAILSDREFFHEIANRLVDHLMNPENQTKFEPLLEKLRQKIQGTMLTDKAMDATIDRMISTSIKEENPDIAMAVDAVKSVSPKYGRFLEKHPELAPRILDRLQKRGLLPMGEDDSGNGITYGQS